MSRTADGAWRSLIPAPERDRVPLALGMELRRRDPADDRHWSARPLRTATAPDLVRDPGELFLGVRPLRAGTGERAWIHGDATWDAVRRPGTRFATAHSRWFADLLSISRDSLLSGTAGDWLLLDPVESPLLWAHLRRAGEVGIPFVATEKNTTLRWASDVRVAIHARPADRAPDWRRAADGGGQGSGVLLTAAVEFDGQTAEPTTVRPIGSGGLHAHRVTGTSIEVRLAEHRLEEPVRALLARGGSLTVGEGDRPAFEREALPILRRRVTLSVAEDLTLPDAPPPRPVLSLTHRSRDVVDFRLEWEYAGLGRYPFDGGAEPERDADAEQDLREEVIRVWQGATETPFSSSGRVRDADAAEFVTRVTAALERRGVLVVVTGTSRRYHELTGAPEITVSTVESTDPDWFDLGVIVRIEGRAIPFEPLFRALSLRRSRLLLVDGSWFSLRHPSLDRLRELIDEAVDLAEWETGPRIHRTQVSLWADFEDLADEARPAVAWRERARGLSQAEEVPATPVPAAITAELRPYQREEVDWLSLLWSHRLGGILADDMGLGKTLQLLALIARAREQGATRPCLVVAPTSVLGA